MNDGGVWVGSSNCSSRSSKLVPVTVISEALEVRIGRLETKLLNCSWTSSSNLTCFLFFGGEAHVNSSVSNNS
jgi:hypothetical protein